MERVQPPTLILRCCAAHTFRQCRPNSWLWKAECGSAGLQTMFHSVANSPSSTAPLCCNKPNHQAFVLRHPWQRVGRSTKDKPCSWSGANIFLGTTERGSGTIPSGFSTKGVSRISHVLNSPETKLASGIMGRNSSRRGTRSRFGRYTHESWPSKQLVHWPMTRSAPKV